MDIFDSDFVHSCVLYETVTSKFIEKYTRDLLYFQYIEQWKFFNNYYYAEHVNWPGRHTLIKWMFGHLHDIGRGNGKTADAFHWRRSQITKNGAHTWRMLHRPILLVYSPKLVKMFLNIDENGVKKNGMIQRIFPKIMRNSIIFRDGADWKTHKKLLLPFFHSGSLQKFTNHFIDATNGLIKCWSKNAQRELSFRIDNDLQLLTLRTIMNSLLGMDIDLTDDQSNPNGLPASFKSICKMTQIPKKLKTLISRLPILWRFTSEGRNADKVCKTMKRLVTNIRTTSKERKLDSDMAHFLSTKGLSKDEITSDIFAFIFAGHETSKLTLSWCFYELSRRPELQEEIFNEFKSEEAKGTSFQDLINKENILTSFISEIQRFYSIAPEIAPRVLTKAIKLPNGTVAPAGTHYMVGIWECHMNPYAWHEPEIFKPRRFLDDRIEPCSFIPFSGGQRKCIGYKYALLQVRTVVLLMIKSFHFISDPTHKVNMTRVMTMSPHDGVKLSVQLR